MITRGWDQPGRLWPARWFRLWARCPAAWEGEALLGLRPPAPAPVTRPSHPLGCRVHDAATLATGVSGTGTLVSLAPALVTDLTASDVARRTAAVETLRHTHLEAVGVPVLGLDVGAAYRLTAWLSAAVARDPWVAGWALVALHQRYPGLPVLMMTPARVTVDGVGPTVLGPAAMGAIREIRRALTQRDLPARPGPGCRVCPRAAADCGVGRLWVERHAAPTPAADSLEAPENPATSSPTVAATAPFVQTDWLAAAGD